MSYSYKSGYNDKKGYIKRRDEHYYCFIFQEVRAPVLMQTLNPFSSAMQVINTAYVKYFRLLTYPRYSVGDFISSTPMPPEEKLSDR